ncbi:MAG: hemagluttinin family protein, partial [Parcubacteria group bacterium Gr01-1014_56]
TAATRTTYGGYFSGIGDTSGTTSSYGIYATATGSDTNYGIYSAVATYLGTAAYGASLSDCDAASTSKLLWSDTGVFSCGTDATGSGASFPFTPTENFGVNTSATSTALFAQSGLFASSTSRFAGISTISATTTNLLSTGSTTIAGQLNAVGGATLGNLTAGASTLSSLTVGSLTGPLQAIAGVVSATSTLSTVYGGTGISTLPSYGNLLVGNSAGGYTLTATSSLGLLGSSSISATAPLSYNQGTGVFSISQSGSGADGYLSSIDWNFFNQKVSSSSLATSLSTFKDWKITGTYLTPTSTIQSIIAAASSTIGNGSQTGGLTISGGATTTGNAYFAGSVGVGSTTPFATFGIHAASTSVATTLFAIGSTSNTGASTTLLSVSNTGLLTFLTQSGNNLTVTNATATNATSTNFFSTNALFTNLTATGATTSALSVSASSTITGQLNAVGGATLGTLNLSGIITSTATGANVLPYASTTMITAATASTTALIVSGLNAASCDVKADTQGVLSCGTDATGGGGSYPFTPGVFGATAVSATSTALQLQGGLFASSTVRFGNAGVSPFFYDGSVGSVGIGTTTPWGLLSVNPSGISGPAFVIGSSTATLFSVTYDGGVTSGALFNYGGNSTSTIKNNSPYAWTIATSSTARPLFSIDTTSAAEVVTVGSGYTSDVIVGAVGAASNLVFEESSTIHGQGANTLTFGQAGDIINFAVKTGFATTTPISTVSIQGSLCVRDTGNCGTTNGTIYATTAAIVDIDLAENYPTLDETLTTGEIVSLDTSATSTVKRASWGERPLGIVSGSPGLLLGSGIANAKAIALKGRVPLLVNLEGGSIAIGDSITISSVSGVGTKATTTVRSVATALQNYTGPGTSLIEVFVESSMYFAPDYFANIFPFTPGTNFGVNVNSTSTPINFTQGLFASSTSRFAGISTISASTTLLSVTSSSTIASVLNVGGTLNANGALTVLGNTSLQGATSTSFAITSQAAGCANFLTGGSLVSTGSACGSGGGGSDFTYPTVLSAITAATTSPLAVFNAAYFGSTGTTTITSSGFLGVGSTSPFAKLSVHANATETNQTLFAIGSSTASATTTLFSVSNSGVLTLSSVSTSTISGGLNVATGGLRVSTLTSAACDVKADTSGNLSCGTDAQGAGGSNPFVWLDNFGTTTAATTSPIWAQNGIFASSTSHFVYASTTMLTVSGTASTTALIVSGLNATACDVKADTSGNLSCGTDATSAGGSPFVWLDNFGTTTAATSSPIWAQAGIFASSTSRIASTTFAINGNVGVGTTSPWAKFSIQTNNAADERFPALVIATTSLGGFGQEPLFYVGATTTGTMDFARVAIGTTSPWGSGGLRDQFTVAGRIYSTWRYVACDFPAMTQTAAIAATTLVPNFCGGFAFVPTTNGATFAPNASQSTTNRHATGSPIVLSTVASAATAQGQGSSVRALLAFAPAYQNPVLEAVIANANNGGGPVAASSSIIMVGFNGTSVTATPVLGREPDQFIGFIASSSTTTPNSIAQNWYAVVRNGSTRQATYTNVATSTLTTTGTSSPQRLRIEVTANKVTFLINGNIATTVTQSIPQVNLTPTVSVANAMTHTNTRAGAPAGVRLLLYSMRFWLDDPPNVPEVEVSSGQGTYASTEPEKVIYDWESLSNISQNYRLTNTPDIESSPGNLVSIDVTSSTSAKVTARSYDPTLVGVINNTAHTTLGRDYAGTVKVAISGRAIVNVTSENGAIKPGDPITSSSLLGQGMKATKPGFIIGKALESLYVPDASSTVQCPSIEGTTTPMCSGSILVELNVGFAMNTDEGPSTWTQALTIPATLTDALGELASTTFAKAVQFANLVTNRLIAQVAIIGDLFADNITATVITADTVNAKTLCLEDVCVTKDQLQLLLDNAGTSGAPSTGSGQARGGGAGSSTPPVDDTSSTGSPQAGTTTPSDTEAPVITLSGNNPATVDIGTSYVDLGASITDNIDQNLGFTVSLDGGASISIDQLNIDTTAAGEHSVLFSATDQAGNTGTATRIVTVVNPNVAVEPTPTSTSTPTI